VGVANFANPEGLSSEGDSLSSETANSGQAELGAPGQGGRGELRPGVLEGSNVDMTDQFSNMITSRTGVDANVGAAKVQDEMMGSLLDLTG
jgi:flagellar hook protein FlgE